MHSPANENACSPNFIVLFEELHSVGYWLIGGPDEMPVQRLMSLNWTDKLDSVLCVQDALERTLCMLLYEI